MIYQCQCCGMILSQNPLDPELRDLERKVFAEGNEQDRERLCAAWGRLRTGKPKKAPRKPRPDAHPVHDGNDAGGWSQVITFTARSFVKDDHDRAGAMAVLARDLSEQAMTDLLDEAPTFEEIQLAEILEIRYAWHDDLTGVDWWHYLVRVYGTLNPVVQNPPTWEQLPERERVKITNTQARQLGRILRRQFPVEALWGNERLRVRIDGPSTYPSPPGPERARWLTALWLEGALAGSETVLLATSLCDLDGTPWVTPTPRHRSGSGRYRKWN